jgi:hypothetical protein
MTHLIKILFVVIAFYTIGISTSLAQKGKNPNVAEKDLKEWVTYLSDDKMRGRKNGSSELEEAANYIAKIFKDNGMKPLPGAESYFQEYQITPRSGAKPFTERNVIGVLEGSDKKLKEEYIILSAHYDHLGVGRIVKGDSIYNGADDNATGVATVLGIAKAIKDLKGKALKRSIIFIAFSGEELGLLGSKYFGQKETEIIKKTIVNFNFEMTGHSSKLGKRKFYITGDEISTISDFVGKHTKNSDWEHIADPFKEMNLFFRSDNASLAITKKENELLYGIPAHTFCTWGSESHYHQPNDEADFVDYENMTSFVNFLAQLTINLANSDERIEWKDERFRRP